MENKSILNIKFDARIKEGLIRRDTLYKPMMSSPNAYKSYNNIFFIPFVLINNNDLNNAIGMELNKQERQLVFLNVRQFNSYIRYLTGRDDLPKLTQEQREGYGGIIEKNITYLLELFFGNKSLFYLSDKEYTIQSYEWEKKFNYQNNSAEINIRLLLSQGRDDDFMQSVGVSCAQKWDSIKADYTFLTGFKEDPNKSKEANEKAKQDWKDTYAMKEVDAPYTLQPSSRKNNSNSLRSKTKTYTPSSSDSAQVQAAKIQAQTKLTVEKMRADEKKKERLYEQKIREEEEKKQKAEDQKTAKEINYAKSRLQNINNLLTKYSSNQYDFLENKMNNYKDEIADKIAQSITKKEKERLIGQLNKKQTKIDNVDSKIKSLRYIEKLNPTKDYKTINSSDISTKIIKAKNQLDELLNESWGDFDKRKSKRITERSKVSGGYKKRTFKRKNKN